MTCARVRRRGGARLPGRQPRRRLWLGPARLRRQRDGAPVVSPARAVQPGRGPRPKLLLCVQADPVGPLRSRERESPGLQVPPESSCTRAGPCSGSQVRPTPLPRRLCAAGAPQHLVSSVRERHSSPTVKPGGSKRCCAVAAGILVQEILKPDVFWYNAGLPENLPGINFGGPDGKVRRRSRAPVDNSFCPHSRQLADRLQSLVSV